MDILKFRSQLFGASEQLAVQLRQAQNTLTRWGSTVAEKPRKLREALRAREDFFRKSLASSRDAIVVTNRKITKFRLLLFRASEQLTVQLRLAQNTLTRWGSMVAEKLRRLLEAIRAKNNYLRKLLASSRDAIVVTNGKVTEFRSQLLNASEQLMVELRAAQNTLTRLGRMVAEKPRNAMVVTNGKISEFRSQLFSASEQLTVQLRL